MRMHWTTWSLIPLWTTCAAAPPDSAAAPALDYAAVLADHRAKCRTKPNSAFCWMDDSTNVDATCQFSARVGLAARGPSPVGPRLDLRFGNDERWAAVPHELTGKPARAFAKQPRLCALSSGEPYEGPSPSLLLIANDVDYVFRLWPYFVNKALWASSTKHRLSVCIGVRVRPTPSDSLQHRSGSASCPSSSPRRAGTAAAPRSKSASSTAR